MGGTSRADESGGSGTEDRVVIVGAGPVGLWLAAELRLRDVPVTVLETREHPDPHSRALTVHPRTLEVLDCRGVVEPFLRDGVRIPSGHFAALRERMDFAPLDTPFPFTLALPQARTEELLAAHATSAGAEVLREHRVTGLRPGTDHVDVTVEGPHGSELTRAAYVVGCDGTRSTVRQAAGIDFPGTPATLWAWLGDVVLDAPPGTPSFSGPHGNLMVFPLPGGVSRIVGNDPVSLRPDHPGELTFEELRATVTRIAGTDFGMRDPRWLSRFGNAARQAAQYRSGRVLLAGDAAHMHFPAGGPGLNVGIQDATALGWRLAAVFHGSAPDELLDTYHAERHPVGTELLMHTQAQAGLMTTYSNEGHALRALLGQLITTVPEFSLTLAERLSGLSVAYPPREPDAHPLTGQRAPDLRFTSGVRLFELLRDGRHVLLDLTGESGAEAVGPRTDVVFHSARLATPRPAWSAVRAALVRPDGHVAWASDTEDARHAPATATATAGTVFH
ncbi:FAD-dependent monooxygenase [Streptomyces sp. NPDC047017]|uniref:FAD-dependent monooxygenase n=1 Tax=Streptomyces sp. NPDC047017 TaxID=3155024 RepID=UPI0033CABA0C